MNGKRIILAVSGSIAAYKSAYLLRALITEGCQVQVLMTDAARAFVSPLTFSTLSKRPVFHSVINADQWNNHVELGLWADAMVIAPATANTIAKCVQGRSDNMVVATYLSARCPVFVAPAMDLDMWHHKSTAANIDTLISRGNHIIPVGHGELASGLVGEGRMAEPDDIMAHLAKFFEKQHQLQGKKILVTAGPTREPVDPVRFIGNPSTGKMGIAVADACALRGADVHLVLGPTHHRPRYARQVTNVETATEMRDATVKKFADCDIAILTAAVADYKPANYSAQKVKKGDGPLHIELIRTPDIAAELGERKSEDQIIVGFALETHDAEINARDKLERKNFDLIVLNTLEDEGAGFAHDTNKVTFIYKNSASRTFDLKSKTAVAEDIADAVVELIKATV